MERGERTSKGIYSINLTSTGLCRVNSTNSSNSSSLTPLITTTLTFTNLSPSTPNPSSTALSTAPSTLPHPLLLVILSNFASTNVSRLKFTAFNPAPTILSHRL